MVRIICKNCNKEFKIKPSRANSAIYCSLKCRWEVEGTSKIVNCAYCGKPIKRIGSRLREHNYCNARCQMNYEYANDIRDSNGITEKAHIRTREMAKEGIHPFQNPEVKIKSNRELGRRNYGKTWLEEKFGWMLNELGIKADSQFPIKYGKDVLNRDRYYFVDFAIPPIKLAIECDGEYWHRNKEKENKRQRKIENLGWKMIRFTGKEIKNNLFGCGSEILEAIVPILIE